MDNQQLNLLKKLLPGLLPILVFILVDTFWSTEAGLIVAVAFGVAQFAYIYFREKRIDLFVLFDTLLLVIMGVISIMLVNDIFFKLKPALINLIMCAILGVSAFVNPELLISYTQRYMPGMQMPPQARKAFQKTLKLFFFVLLAYTLLIVYSAFYMSRETWAFISGALLYIVFGAVLLFQFLVAKFKKSKAIVSDDNTEWLPLLNEKGEIIGKAARETVHNGSGKLHPVVHLHIINSKGDIYLQLRPMHKQIQPGKWDIAVGGHVAFGETIEQALVRETAEELNISGIHPKPLAQYKWETDVETEMVFSFWALYNATPVFNRAEVADGRFWSRKEILENKGKNIFTPNFEAEIPLIFETITKK